MMMQMEYCMYVVWIPETERKRTQVPAEIEKSLQSVDNRLQAFCVLSEQKECLTKWGNASFRVILWLIRSGDAICSFL